MSFNTDHALLIMTHLKLGDFLVMTPHLRALQNVYPGVTVAVPDFLFQLFEEQKIFKSFIRNSEADAYVQNKFPSVLNLSFPLLPGLHVGDGHKLLNGDHFRKLQHVFKSYEEALRDYFPLLPVDTDQAPYLFFDGDPSIFKKWNVKPFAYFTLHSGSDFAPKNWEPKNFETLAITILSQYPDLECLSLVGPCDQPLFSNTKPPDRFREIRDDIRAITHLMSGSLFHVDNDSGIHHLAGAMDVPSITVFGATGPGSWSSLTNKNFIHWGAPNCPHPCDGAKLTTCENRICLSSVKVEHLVDSAQTILSAY